MGVSEPFLSELLFPLLHDCKDKPVSNVIVIRSALFIKKFLILYKCVYDKTLKKMQVSDYLHFFFFDYAIELHSSAQALQASAQVLQ